MPTMVFPYLVLQTRQVIWIIKGTCFNVLVQINIKFNLFFPSRHLTNWNSNPSLKLFFRNFGEKRKNLKTNTLFFSKSQFDHSTKEISDNKLLRVFCRIEIWASDEHVKCGNSCGSEKKKGSRLTAWMIIEVGKIIQDFGRFSQI